MTLSVCPSVGLSIFLGRQTSHEQVLMKLYTVQFVVYNLRICMKEFNHCQKNIQGASYFTYLIYHYTNHKTGSAPLVLLFYYISGTGNGLANGLVGSYDVLSATYSIVLGMFFVNYIIT